MTAKQGSGRSRSHTPPGRRPGEIIAAVRPIAEQLAFAHDLLVWDMEFRRDAGRETLRVACDRVGGVSSDVLAQYAEDLSRELDHIDVVPGEQRYVLEVTSPGAERRLRSPNEFRICVGREVRVTLRDGRIVEGTLAEPTDDVIEIETPEGRVRLFFDDIAKAQLVVKGIG